MLSRESIVQSTINYTKPRIRLLCQRMSLALTCKHGTLDRGRAYYSLINNFDAEVRWSPKAQLLAAGTRNTVDTPVHHAITKYFGECFYAHETRVSARAGRK